jgi:hypothetical protein
MCRGVFRDSRWRRALAVEKVKLGRSCGQRGRGRRRRCLLGVFSYAVAAREVFVVVMLERLYTLQREISVCKFTGTGCQ